MLGRDDKPPAKSMMEAMPYTQSLLSNGSATAYHAKAAPPTVTMPRLKAMLSGAIGGFLDVAFNFNTQALLDDNLLDQFYRIGWKLVMLGDETWIKLFPRLFTRQDGVSSFYVKDTVEVDFNVSRHLEYELANKDWSLLILHYLGLDHVGHIGGRRSNLMAPKLKEMDEVIKLIHIHKILDQNNDDGRTLLVVVSDHGMTDGGNHGGSSYEEADSLALFIGLGSKVQELTPSSRNSAQVDITPTLAILFGVPIPKNNVGVLLRESFDSLSDKQILRALELNSWQLLRLLQAHMPGLLCGDLSCVGDEHTLQIHKSSDSTRETLCDLLSRAVSAHRLWENHHDSAFISNSTDSLMIAVGSYYSFLQHASEWLSSKATDKPVNLLLSGIIVMLISCVVLVNLLFCVVKEAYFKHMQPISPKKGSSHIWHIDEAFVFLGIVVHVLSLCASSMVEEEQYTWHFLTSTLYLIFFFTTIESLLKGYAFKSTVTEVTEKTPFHQSLASKKRDDDIFFFGGLIQPKKYKLCYCISSVLLVLICGRILRGWHRGGVNWNHLPDISKWLEQTGFANIKFFQIASLVSIIILSSLSLCLMKSRRNIALLSISSHCVSGLLVLMHIQESWSHNLVPMDHNSTSLVQLFYVIVGMTTVITVITSPWILPVQYSETYFSTKSSNSHSADIRLDSLLLCIRDLTYLIGITCASSWCLLQLLLQQTINAVPVLLIFLQFLGSILYFSVNGSHQKQWVEVAALYFLGMTGHFGLGNSNNLATIDVAGAFIGISSHSTVLSGILMFAITYASPILSFLSMLVYISMKELMCFSDLKKADLGSLLQILIVFPCVLPLVLNSVVLTAFTIILLLMRNHLFVWSVFSPKYLYVCVATVSVYVGVCIIAATLAYVCAVIFFRTRMLR